MANGHDPEETPDYRGRERFKAAKQEILAVIKTLARQKRAIYIGALRRRFTQYTDILLGVLMDLKLDGVISFDEHSPPPTLIMYKTVKRQKNLIEGMRWNDVPVLKRRGTTPKTFGKRGSL